MNSRVEASRLVLGNVPVSLFGHAPTHARLELQTRSRVWRAGKAAVPLAAGMVAAPLVAVFPPHAPWALIALVTGGLLARRRWKEHYTVQSSRAPCPRCGSELPLASGARLRFPHPVTCAECGHEPVVEVSRAFVSGAEVGDEGVEETGNEGEEEAGNEGEEEAPNEGEEEAGANR